MEQSRGEYVRLSNENARLREQTEHYRRQIVQNEQHAADLVRCREQLYQTRKELDDAKRALVQYRDLSKQLRGENFALKDELKEEKVRVLSGSTP